MIFYPCKKGKNNDPYLDWDCANNLTISMKDFDLLLKEPFFSLYPIIDPDTNEEISKFDYTSFNEISYNYWFKFINTIKNELIPQATEQENTFYTEFLLWLEKALESSLIIVIDGSL